MKNPIKVFHWLPRIICILAILFISLFAMDAFAPGQTLWQQIGAFVMHLIPSFVLLVFLLVAWKWELIGGIIFTTIGLGMTPLIFLENYKANNSIWTSLVIVLTITFPFAIVGVLFIVSYLKKKSLHE